MFENHRRGRQARIFTTNVPKILDLKSSSEQIFFRKLSLGAPVSTLNPQNENVSLSVPFISKTPVAFIVFGVLLLMFNLTLLLPCSPLTNLVDLVFWIRLTKVLSWDQGSFRSPFCFPFFPFPRPAPVFCLLFPSPEPGSTLPSVSLPVEPGSLFDMFYPPCQFTPASPSPPISSKPCRHKISSQLADRRNHWGRLWLKLCQLKLRLLQLLSLIHVTLMAWGRISSTPWNNSYSTLTQSSALLSNCVTLQLSVTLIAV